MNQKQNEVAANRRRWTAIEISMMIEPHANQMSPPATIGMMSQKPNNEAAADRRWQHRGHQTTMIEHRANQISPPATIGMMSQKSNNEAVADRRWNVADHCTNQITMIEEARQTIAKEAHRGQGLQHHQDDEALNRQDGYRHQNGKGNLISTKNRSNFFSRKVTNVTNDSIWKYNF